MLLLCVIIFECNYSSANLPKMSNIILGILFWVLFSGAKREVGWGSGMIRHGSKGEGGHLKIYFLYLFGVFFLNSFLSILKFVILF